MKKDLYDSKIYDDLNITSMLDLAWTLLVVFIISITAAVQGIKVNLPKASSAPALEKPTTKAITIHSSGQIYLDAYPVTLTELESMLRGYKAADPNLPVIIKGDEQIYYQKVVDILDLLQKLEISQLGLVTQKVVK
ncbi:MAG: biopolymer transporter ExbD [Desulfobulbaceae bacterium]|nr:biopolymer transporter ExbD [Desulfobulbaceae bacterium]